MANLKEEFLAMVGKAFPTGTPSERKQAKRAARGIPGESGPGIRQPEPRAVATAAQPLTEVPNIRRRDGARIVRRTAKSPPPCTNAELKARIERSREAGRLPPVKRKKKPEKRSGRERDERAGRAPDPVAPYHRSPDAVTTPRSGGAPTHDAPPPLPGPDPKPPSGGKGGPSNA
jgi:hypothetical protein